VGQKVHPVGYRLGFTKTWNAKWFAEAKNYRILLKEDIAIRSTIRGRLRDAAIARIDIERSTNQVTVTIQTAKPGVVIGKGGAKVEELRQALGKATGKVVKVNIFEIRYPELDANLIAENVAQQLERRVSFRKVLKQTVSRSMKAGAKGVRVAVAGRLGGAEMSRRPRPRYHTRFMRGPSSASALFTYRFSIVMLKLFSAFAIAEPFGRCSRIEIASSADFPVIKSVTSRAFRGETRWNVALAFTSTIRPPP